MRDQDEHEHDDNGHDEHGHDPLEGFEVEDDGLDEASYERLHERRQRRLTRQRAVFAALVVAVLLVGGVAALIGTGTWRPGGGSAAPTASPSCTAPAQPQLLPPDQVTVDSLLNGTQRRGLAATVAAELRSRGLVVAGVGNAGTPAGPVTAVVRYPPEREQQARTVAARFPDAQLAPDPASPGVEVSVGDGYQQLLAEDALATPAAATPAPTC